MSDHWLYSRQLPAGAADWTLEGEEAQHGRAKHLEAGEAIHLFDGRGCVAAARVVECGKRALTVRIEAVEMVRPRPPRVTIAVSQPKGERLDWMLEKLTELGVAGIWPMQCERSVAHVREDRVERWQRRLIEAGKQAHVAWLPELEGSQSLVRVLERAGEFGRRMVADTARASPATQAPPSTRRLGVAPKEALADELQSGDSVVTASGGTGGTGGSTPANSAGVAPAPKEALADELPVAPGRKDTAQAEAWTPNHGSRSILAVRFAPADRLLVVIGPEGGFSDVEREAMRRSGFVSVSLGATVLRTETAAIVAAGCLLAVGAQAGLSGGGVA